MQWDELGVTLRVSVVTQAAAHSDRVTTRAQPLSFSSWSWCLCSLLQARPKLVTLLLEWVVLPIVCQVTLCCSHLVTSLLSCLLVSLLWPGVSCRGLCLCWHWAALRCREGGGSVFAWVSAQRPFCWVSHL